MLPEQLSTDLTSLGEGEERLAVVIEMVVGADGAVGESAVYRAIVLNRAKLAYNGVAAWLDGSAPPPPTLAAVRGLDAQIRLQDGVGAGDEESPAPAAARLSLETIEARPVFDGDVAGRPPARREEPGQGADRGLHDRGERRDREVPRGQGLSVDAARPAHARALGSHRRARGDARRAAARRAGRRGARSVPRRAAARPIPLRFPDLSLVRREAAGLGRIRGRAAGRAQPTGTSGSPCATTRTRPRPTGASPISSRSAC